MAFKAEIVIIALTVIATEDVGGENGDTCRNQRDKNMCTYNDTQVICKQIYAKEQNSTGLERFLLFSTILTCSEAFKSSSTTEDKLSSKTNVS